MIKLKRAYQPMESGDGYRVLVDRLWPRGVSKQKAKLDLWLKEIAPSNELRIWFGHDPQKWSEFKKRYLAELEQNVAAVNQIEALAKQHKTLTLVYAAKDSEHNEAVVLAEYLQK